MTNGYTPTIPYRVRIANLLEIIPQARRLAAVANAWIGAKKEVDNASFHDFERHLQSEAYRYINTPADYDTIDPMALRTSQMIDASIAANWDVITEMPL